MIDAYNLARAELEESMTSLDHSYSLISQKKKNSRLKEKRERKKGKSKRLRVIAWMPESNLSVHSGGSCNDKTQQKWLLLLLATDKKRKERKSLVLLLLALVF